MRLYGLSARPGLASSATGKWTVNVTNADGRSGTKAKAFRVTG